MSEQKMWLVYSYDSNGNDKIVTIHANTCSEAFDKFDEIYGDDLQIDFVATIRF
jgi:hypothetical protein